jgi:glutamyl-tRNA synthetase
MFNSESMEIAKIILPDVLKTADYYENLYPKRELEIGAEVTRFAPSPTGYLHVGGLYTAMVSNRIAKQSKGVYYLRIEDTDKKREVVNGVNDIILALGQFGIKFDEGVDINGNDFGKYGPYKQSDRKEIYRTIAKLLIQKGFAYPCFCTEQNLEQTRKVQESKNLRPGYYNEYAVCRGLNLEQITKMIDDQRSFVLRLKSNGDWNKTFILNDKIKGMVEMPQNDQDIVLLKSDGMPTYHFAHVVDDHLMRTTTVTRGDEWLSSAPIHVQLFEFLEWELPNYAHFSTIQKEENGAKRKLSKRKDPEATVTYYHEKGIPAQSLTEYLLNIANSNFEEWRRENPHKSNMEFQVQLGKMSVSGSLFDMTKLLNISKNIVSEMTAKEVYEQSLNWASHYDKDLYNIMINNSEYVIRIFDIERGTIKPRKDIAKWSDVRDYIIYFFDEEFEKEIRARGYDFNAKLKKDEIKEILNAFLKIYDPSDEQEIWFQKLKEICPRFGFCNNVKEYKKSPENFKGHIGDFAEIFRITLANRKNTPDLCEIMKVMGKNRIEKRFGMV